MEAIIYSRWSSLEQTNTTSAPRQLELNKAFAERQGWPVIREITDSGKSAWTGDNIRTGELGKLIDQLERSGSGAGKVLVVEKLDRLSRQPALTMSGWIQRACATGLTIATSDEKHLINSDRLVRDHFVVLSMIFDAFRAYEESQNKSDRVGKAWDKKRQRGVAMTRQCPGWLTINAKQTAYQTQTPDAAYIPIPERVATVRRIFDLTEAGVGKATIASILNREGVPVFGRGNGWHPSYIQKIIQNPAVIGEYQPHTKPKGGARKPVGDVIRGYFPAIISIEQFERVNDRRAAKVLAQSGSGNRLVNLLSGLARCTKCGGTMTLANKGTETLANGTQVARRYLICSSAHRSRGCNNRLTFEYGMVESTILDKVLHLAMDDQHFANPTELGEAEVRLMDAQRALTLAKKRQSAASEDREADPDDEVAKARYYRARDDVKTAQKVVAELEGTVAKVAGAVTPREHVARVNEVRAMMDDPDEATRYEARSRVKLALNDMVDGVMFGSIRRFWLTLAKGSRVFAFGADGLRSHDYEWSDLDSSDPIIAAYQRRKGRAA